jgi:hypothetical protein
MKPGGLAAFKLYVSTGFNLYSEPHRALLRPLHGGGQISASHLHGGLRRQSPHVTGQRTRGVLAQCCNCKYIIDSKANRGMETSPLNPKFRKDIASHLTFQVLVKVEKSAEYFIVFLP